MDWPRPALEHGTTRTGRWLRAHRVRLALWIAVIEGVLLVAGVVSRWLVLLVAGAALAFYVLVGREVRSDAGRQASWIAALSQVLVALVPLLLFVLGAVAVIAVGVLAVLALVALLADRR